MATKSVKIPCGPCRSKTRNNTSSRPNVSNWYCMDCDDFFCNECKILHNTFKGNRKHTVYGSERAPEKQDLYNTLSDKDSCKKHRGRKMDQYCMHHEAFCCLLCVNDGHRDCSATLMPIARQRERILGKFVGVRTTYHNLKKQLENLRQLDEYNQRKIEDSVKDIPRKFQVIRETLSAILDKAEEKAKAFAIKTLEIKKSKVSDHLKKCNEIGSSIERSLDILELAVGTEVQRTIAEFELGYQAGSFQKKLKELQDSSREVTIGFRLNEDIELSLRESKNIFEVDIKDTQDTPRVADKPFHERLAQYVGKFETKTSGDKQIPSITSCAFTPDNRLLLTDMGNNKLKVYDSNFKFTRARSFPHWPWCVAVLDNEEVTVTFPKRKEIARLTIEGDIMEKAILSVSFKCRAIAYVEKEKYAVTACPDIFALLNIDGSEIARITTDEANNSLFYEPYYLTLNAKKTVAYVSNNNCHEVCAVDLQALGKVHFSYRHDELEAPYGVTVDKEGNVYVCGSWPQNIHQITEDGQLVKIMLSKKDAKKHLQTMCFKPAGNMFVLAELGVESVKIYDMN